MYERIKEHVERKFVDNNRMKQNTLASIYSNFIECENEMFSTRIMKFHKYVKNEYGLRTHIIDYNTITGIVSLSYSITDRYFIVLFLDANENRIKEANKRAATRFFLHASHLTKEEIEVCLPLINKTKKSKELEGKKIGINGRGRGRRRRRNRRNKKGTASIGDVFMKNDDLLTNRRGMNAAFASHEGKNNVSSVYKRKKQVILNMKTNGILEIALFSCFCKRDIIEI
jgi:hypothetical protein